MGLRATVVTVLMLGVSVARANVSLQNGNFNVGYTDIVYTGGFEPKVERVYNAKTGFKGIFGWGWGSEFEVYLQVSGDGSVVVNEYGGGAENVFVAPGHPTKVELEEEVALLVKARGKSDAEVAPYRARLLADGVFRNDEWGAMLKEKKVPPREVPLGTELLSDRFSHQSVTRTPEGFVRTFDNKRVELYDVQGRLVRVTDPNNHFLQFTRDSQGRIAAFEDDAGRKISFSYTKKGLVSGLVGTDGKTTRRASYRYDARDDLIYSKDVDGNVYEHIYNARHNMTEIRYGDGTTMVMGYHSKDRNENIATVKERDGTITAYSYFTDPVDDSHTFIAVEVSDREGNVISDSKYEYYKRVTVDGREVTERAITTLDGDRTDTTYMPRCGVPLRIEHNDEVTVFEYDARCHVTFKSTPTETTRLTYDEKAGKVTRVERQTKGSKETWWSAFRYDDRGNLIHAENSNGTQLALEYDGFGRIAVLRQTKPSATVLKFTYNKASKPIQIEAEGLGSIHIRYTPNGEIEKVDSDAGRTIALQVTSSFQSLLDVIRPAGVTLSF